MKLYRVTNKKYADDFNGLGASYEHGARWNSAGRPVIYYGLDMATALVEAANYHPSPKLMPHSHCKALYEVDDSVSVERLSLSKLPSDWQEMPYPASTQKVGDGFLESSRALLLLVPSVAVGLTEYSMAVFNPLHPEAQKIRLLECLQPVYSERMFSGL